MSYYYEICGKAAGPVNEEEILKLFRRQTIGLQTRIWTVGEKDWAPFERTPLINKALPLGGFPPALTPNSNPKSKRLFVFVALAILLGQLGIHNFYVGNTIRGSFQLSAFIFITICWYFIAKTTTDQGVLIISAAFLTLYASAFLDAENIRVDSEGRPFK